MGSWAIVGGGMLGSALALDLAESGADVTLFESASELGGLASAWSIGDVVWDRHYHVTLLSDTHTRRVLRRLGLEDEMSWVETSTGTWAGGKLYSMSSTVDYIKYPPLSVLDKGRLAWTILSGNRVADWRNLENIPVETWLRQKSGDRVFEGFWLPLLKAKLGDAYVDTSAAFIWATIQRLYAARSQGLKKEMFGYVPGGYARVLEVMGETLTAAGVDLRLGARVGKVQPGPTVVADGGEERFDHVVVTAAPPVAKHIIEGLEPLEQERLDVISYQGIVCASVLTSRPLAGYYLTYLYDEAPFTAVVEMSAFVDAGQFGGRTLIYLPKYCSPDDLLFEETDEAIAESFLPALEKVYPMFSRSDVEAFQVSRVRNVFPISTLGYSNGVPGFDTSIFGVHLVSSAQIVNGTLNVNDTIALAERASRHLVALDAAGVR
jgi:protoporphyrinogen oxidase